MRSLFDRSHSGTGAWTVTDLTAYIRDLFEVDLRLRDLEVAGEISNFTEARSGHLYFTLKDVGAQIRCVMWRRAAGELPSLPADGDAVVVRGRVSVYEAGGTYQLYADWIEPAGQGDLAAAFESLKARLGELGLFESEHKQPIPRLPGKLGIVTSADAAALRDILSVLERRWPLVKVLVAPSLVQGAEAPGQLIRALQWLDGRHDIDTIIIARGGGSLEDLWAFNDEGLARAIFAARHPVIVGVGHETDFTIADFVADVRAPTPSAAAELAVPNSAELMSLLTANRRELTKRMVGQLDAKWNRLDRAVRTLAHLSPRRSLDSGRQRADALLARLEQLFERQLDDRRHRLSLAQARLEAVNPRATLARGYAIVRLASGDLVRSRRQVGPGDDLTVEVSDGKFGVEVINGGTNSAEEKS
ncbi:MAG: exodeoxyribonuclease VII large subunit [Candidatus Promineifilaceae bacterium]|nr:exodeoxyribonuclease VII large subunit [Candidatus Promineifilaceae bacterium]